MASDDRRMTAAMLARLRSKSAAFGDYAKVSGSSGVPIGTLQKMMTGATDPRFATVVDVCRAIGVSIDYVVTGIDGVGESGDWETPLGPVPLGEKRVPVRDIAASAGHGFEVFDEDPRCWFTFPAEWLASMGDPDSMDIVKVEGESMEPELRDGDHVMIDQSQRQVKDGLYVVAVDDHLFVKRVQVVGRGKVVLTSTNVSYRPFEVVLTEAIDGELHDSTRIVGRVVCSVRIL